MPKPNEQALYELIGASLEATKLLEEELRVEISLKEPKQSGKMSEISASWQALYSGLLDRLETQMPEVLERTGLMSPSTIVYKGIQTYPRAYEEYPAIFASPEKNPRFFMYCPVDYQENHFEPEGARLIDSPKEEQLIGDLLFAGGWLGNAPLIDRKKKGVETPLDYKAPSIRELRETFKYHTNDRMVYLAAGRSLEMVEDYKARKEQWENALNDVRVAVEKETKKNKAQMLSHLPAGEDVRISASYSYNMGGQDYAKVLLSASREGKLSIMDAGHRVPIPQSPAYLLQEIRPFEYEVTPRSDTPEGKRLTKVFNAMPVTPSMHDYPELFANFIIEQDQIGQALGINGAVPTIWDLEGQSFLSYNSSPDDRDESFCPPGAIPVPTEVMEWLRSDQGDRNMGNAPPPRPPEVEAVLNRNPKPDPDFNNDFGPDFS